MPFTPIHMGPGILVKSLLQERFSLMVFGWSQIVMDIQPLIVMVSGEGHLHGVTHTVIGAIVLMLLAVPSGKYLSELGLYLIGLNKGWRVNIAWKTATLSACIGTFSHLFLDSIMHTDIEPLFPLTKYNPLLLLVSTDLLHQLCILAAILGGLTYAFRCHRVSNKK